MIYIRLICLESGEIGVGCSHFLYKRRIDRGRKYEYNNDSIEPWVSVYLSRGKGRRGWDKDERRRRRGWGEDILSSIPCCPLCWYDLSSEFSILRLTLSIIIQGLISTSYKFGLLFPLIPTLPQHIFFSPSLQSRYPFHLLHLHYRQVARHPPRDWGPPPVDSS